MGVPLGYLHIADEAIQSFEWSLQRAFRIIFSTNKSGLESLLECALCVVVCVFPYGEITGAGSMPAILRVALLQLSSAFLLLTAAPQGARAAGDDDTESRSGLRRRWRLRSAQQCELGASRRRSARRLHGRRARAVAQGACERSFHRGRRLSERAAHARLLHQVQFVGAGRRRLCPRACG